jgi:hypothetical protein
MLYRSKWCRSSICSRLMGPHSGADRGHQASSGDGDVSRGDTLSSRMGEAGLMRTHVSFRLTQFLHGSPSSHYREPLAVSNDTPSVQGRRGGQQQHGRTLTLRLLQRTQPSLDFCGRTGSVPVMSPPIKPSFPLKHVDLIPIWTNIPDVAASFAPPGAPRP